MKFKINVWKNMSFYRTDATPKWVWLQKRRTERTPNNSHFPLAPIQPIKFKFWWHLKVLQRASSSAEKLIPGENKLLLIVLHLPTNCSPTAEEVWRENCEKKEEKEDFQGAGCTGMKTKCCTPTKVTGCFNKVAALMLALWFNWSAKKVLHDNFKCQERC